MEINYLKWDSEFFKCPVYKISNITDNKLYDFIKNLSEPFICYVFTGEKLLESNKVKLFGGKLIDTKVVFSKSLQELVRTDNHIKEYKSISPSQELYQLAYESGKQSRFKKDNRLPPGTFKNLYNIWIEKSNNKHDNSYVFVYEDKQIFGFITLSIKSRGFGEIGLIAVDSKCQGKGIGKSLIYFVENFLFKKGLNRIKVATQFQNKQAVNFYNKVGYNIEKVDNIYHFVNLNNYEYPF